MKMPTKKRRPLCCNGFSRIYGGFKSLLLRQNENLQMRIVGIWRFYFFEQYEIAVTFFLFCRYIVEHRR